MELVRLWRGNDPDPEPEQLQEVPALTLTLNKYNQEDDWFHQVNSTQY